MKQFKHFLLTVAMLLCSTSCFAWGYYGSDYDFTVDGICYDITSETNNTVRVTYNDYYCEYDDYYDYYTNYDYNCNTKYSGTVTIPESVTYNGTTYSVTSIGHYAFRDCSGLDSVTIPNSVTSIGSSAFYDCSGLTSVTIPNSVKSIGNYAFYGCNNLRTVVNNSNLDIVKGSSNYGYVGYYAYRILSGENINGYYFDENNGEYTLTGYLGDETNLVLPENYKGNAYSINNDAFYKCSDLTSVIIPNSVTSIGSSAFYDCSGLTSVEIPNSVTSIGNSAFYGCNNLRTVVNNSNLDIVKGSSNYGYVGYYAYRILSGENINGYYFDENNGEYTLTGYLGDETNLVLPENYKGNAYSINNDAFRDCSGLTSVTMGNSVTSIGSYAFSGCSDLTSVTMGNSVTSIGSYAFSGCPLKSLTIGAGVLSIGSDQCKPVKTIWLTNTPPSGYKNLQGNINYVANDQYNGLSNVKVYPYLSSAFETGGVKYVPVSPAERTCDAIDCSYDSDVVDINIGETVSFKGVEMKVQNVMPYTVYQQTSVKTLSVSHSGDIGNYAFYGCTGITDATISNDGNIGERAFYGCTGITDTSISNEGNIGEGAFQGAMTSGNAVLKLSSKGDIGDNAFYGCTGITNATISNEGNIGEGAFQGAMTSGNAVLKVSNKGYIYPKAFYGCRGITDATISNEGYIGESAFYGCTALKTANVENKGVISSEAFRGCTALETLTLGENVTSIGGSAFSGCSKLLAVTIPNKTTSLGSYSFAGCSLLKQLDLGNGVRSIGEYSFNGCSALPSIDIPASVTSVGNYTFKGCTSIADVVIKDRTTDLSLGSNGSSPLFADCPLDSVYIGGNISYQTSSSYGYSPFYRNTSLRSVVITDKEEEISDNEFYGCTNLKNVSIGSNVKKIGNWAFSGCSNLDYFSFGKSVESIGEEAFSDCVNMTQLISHAVTPPTCGTQALDDINKWNCILKIPEGTNSAYMAANQWKEFFFIENLQGGLGYQVTFVVDGETVATDSVKLGSTIDLPEPPVKEGYTFTGWENVPEIMPANDITINGSFKVNSYAVKYIVDGVDYATDSVEYGAVVTLIDELEKEGYSFSWSEAPETMPANDITITGEWSINSYLVTFIIDGEVYATDSVEYGAAITLPEVPEKDNSTFEWEEAPETMPASDVTIYGNYVSGISGVTVSGKTDVYTLNGMLYKRDVDLNNLGIELPKGVYIINGKKIMVK